MPSDIKYRIGIGQLNDDILTGNATPVTDAFTFDRTTIFFSSTQRTFDETT